MPLDGLSVRILALELKEICIDAKIQNIFMPTKDTIVFSVYREHQAHNLIFSMNPGNAGVYLSQEKLKNPKTPYGFLMFLRKHLGSGLILDVYTKGYERIIFFDVEQIDESGALTNKKIVVELTGRNCNFIVLNKEDKIMEALRHVDKDMSQVRNIMPAYPYYMPPAQDKIDIEDFNWDFMDRYKDFPLSSAFFKAIGGTASILGQELAYRAGVDEFTLVKNLKLEDKSSIERVIDSFVKDLRNKSYSPTGVFDKKRGSLKDYYIFNLSLFEDYKDIELKKYPSFLQVFSSYMEGKKQGGELVQAQNQVSKSLKNLLTRLERKIGIYEKDLLSLEKIEKYKLYGELLTANANIRIKRQDKIKVFDYYQNEEIEITLDPGKDMAGNAQSYYKNYKRGMATYNYAKKEIEKAKRELEYLLSVKSNLDLAQTKEDVDDIKNELLVQGYIKEKESKKKRDKKKEVVPSFRPYHYLSSQGFSIYVGRNNMENDSLTFEFAQANDIWFHIKGVHGAHVVVKNTNKDSYPPKETMTQAAILAAWYSQAREAGQVGVDYTYIKNVKKPKGAKPGFINYFNYSTAYVKGEKDELRDLELTDKKS